MTGYGNRVSQSITQDSNGSGPTTSYAINTANNQISGIQYDAAGNMMSDGLTHTYVYDAEGNVIQVDNNIHYYYNAFNQRVRAENGSSSTEYVYNILGQRVSVWDGSTRSEISGQYYWGNSPVAFYQGGAIHFQHQNWMGTERSRTDRNGAVEGTYQSLPFGDGFSASGSDNDAYHFAALDRDADDTHHAQFRQYSSTQGRWMSPDPYDGSYDVFSPQSLNRYSYVGNRPLTELDPLGLNPGDIIGSDNGVPTMQGPGLIGCGFSCWGWGAVGGGGPTHLEPMQPIPSDGGGGVAPIAVATASVVFIKSVPPSCQKQLEDMLDDINAIRPPGASMIIKKGLAQRFRQLFNYRDIDVLQTHIGEFQGRQRNLKDKIDQYRNSCGEPPPFIAEWADQPVVAPWPRTSNSSAPYWIGAGVAAAVCGALIPGCLEIETFGALALP
ncbi:MAG: hypothetical protein JSS95_00015 [Acidobacteria bacterium]|nr:hypothetical protein [Acidobacteriota bacterium]